MFTLDGFSIVDADAPEEIVGRRRRQHGAVTSACGCREREREREKTAFDRRRARMLAGHNGKLGVNASDWSSKEY